jgi:hypothetical protein
MKQSAARTCPLLQPNPLPVIRIKKAAAVRLLAVTL